MRTLTLPSLAALSLILSACLPDGDSGTGKGDASTSADTSDTSDTDAPYTGECRGDYSCDRLTICIDGACVQPRCSVASASTACGQDPGMIYPRGCYLPLGVCSMWECDADGDCLVRVAGGGIPETDLACVFGVCQPPL